MNNLPSIVGIGHSVQNKNSVLPPGPPHTYLGMARLLFNGTIPLAAAGPDAATALTFVAGQVAECALKAYLSRHGNDKHLKTRELRHNLVALWNLSQAEGLPLPPPPPWLLSLSVLHNAPYFIRYSTNVHGFVMPGGDPMVTDLGIVVELVSQHIFISLVSTPLG